MKVWTGGRALWTRTIRFHDRRGGRRQRALLSLGFYGTGIIPDAALPAVMLAQFALKTLVEVIFTPVTYAAVGYLKRAEASTISTATPTSIPSRSAVEVSQKSPSTPIRRLYTITSLGHSLGR